ncbi:MAG TPA: AraC family transcriptional regulator [Caulobacteraceae bacterium]
MSRGAILTGYAQVAAQHGVDPRAMLRRVGLDSRVLDDRERRVPARQIYELLELSAQASGCETFGLQMGALRQPADVGPVALLLAHQVTLRDALMTAARYQPMLNEAMLFVVDDEEDFTSVRVELASDGQLPLRQSYELLAAISVQTLCSPAGPHRRPRMVCFTHSPPADLSHHKRVFGPNVKFASAFNGFVWNRADADCVSPAADPRLVEYAEGFIKNLPYANSAALAAEVQKTIHVMLPLNGASTKTVAARLGLSERTMQRRLLQEEVEFSVLLNDIRREHALRHLSNGRLPLSEVASLLGYTRETSFSRWFAHEFGTPPSNWRASHDR